MKIKLQTFVPKLAIALVVLFVYEEFIYGRLALSGMSYLVAKTLSELLLYVLVVLIVLRRMQNGTLMRYRPTVFDISLGIFIVTALLSTRYNGGGFMQGLLNLRTMLRYAAIYYIIVLSGWDATDWQIGRLIKVVIVIALIQSGLCFVQYLAGEQFTTRFFSPVKSEATVEGITVMLNAMGQKLGAAIGTFGKTPSLALFFMLADVMALSYFTVGVPSERTKWLVIYVLNTVGIFLTYKRGPLLLSLFAPLLVAWIAGKRKLVNKYLAIAFIATPLLIVLLIASMPDEYIKENKVEISPLQSISQLFTKDYWSRTNASSRGWVIVEVGSEAISSFNLVGYGADEKKARELLAKKGGTFAKLVSWGGLDDVYVISALVYYGPVGTALLLFGFYYIYRQARFLTNYATGTHQIVGIAFCSLSILTFLASFLVRTLEFRAFAFCLWFFAGIVVSSALRYKRAHSGSVLARHRGAVSISLL